MNEPLVVVAFNPSLARIAGHTVHGADAAQSLKLLPLPLGLNWHLDLPVN